jgi:hypothetical protein
MKEFIKNFLFGLCLIVWATIICLFVVVVKGLLLPISALLALFVLIFGGAFWIALTFYLLGRLQKYLP